MLSEIDAAGPVKQKRDEFHLIQYAVPIIMKIYSILASKTFLKDNDEE